MKKINYQREMHPEDREAQIKFSCYNSFSAAM
jgi:hypothetical protein